MAEARDGTTESLRTQLTEAHEQLLRRDQAFQAWESEVAGLRGELQRVGEWASRLEADLQRREADLQRLEAELQRVNESASRRIAEFEAVIAAMEATRAWRLAERWWAFRGRFRRGSADRR
jgi:chromosome segregation ATPase